MLSSAVPKDGMNESIDVILSRCLSPVRVTGGGVGRETP